MSRTSLGSRPPAAKEASDAATVDRWARSGRERALRTIMREVTAHARCRSA